MAPAAAKHTNRLIDSLSPYLLQHAHNPVDWYPWGAEALGRAQAENKPIFLSIGYSACHWCHVMEHEVFEHEDVAAVLNDKFISIKVDREERPDIDEIYMQATMALNDGNGGWPMSVFLEPNGVPFFAKTYIPKDAFLEFIQVISKTWTDEPGRITQVSGQMKELLENWARGAAATDGLPAAELMYSTATEVAQYFDKVWGGMRSANNKFPPSMSMELMLRMYHATGDETLLPPVRVTLDRMAAGGIYDHLGGGICRYSTDPRWLVPHFEKMLYDQALVSRIYLDGYLVFKEPRYEEVARGILDYVIADLQAPEGGYYSTRDADSEGLEGKFYIWTLEEVTHILGDQDAPLFCAAYDVTAGGNWDERFGHAPPGPKNILNIKQDLTEVASAHGLSTEVLRTRLAAMRQKLLAVRARRVPPGLDDKILTGWNGLMISSFAQAARVLDEPRYAASAARSADFLLTHMRRDGRLLRTYRQGQADLKGYLSDYAFLIDGLLNLYEATFDQRWLFEAEALARQCKVDYYDSSNGAFFFTANDAETLIARTKNPRDGAIPSGNSVHATNLLRLAVLFNEKDFADQATSIFKAFAADIKRSPYAFERLLCALDFYYNKPKEIVVAAASPDGGRALIATVYERFLPNKIVLQAGTMDAALAERIPLLKGKAAVNGQDTAFVCQQYVCRKPVMSAEDLSKALWPQASAAAGSTTP